MACTKGLGGPGLPLIMLVIWGKWVIQGKLEGPVEGKISEILDVLSKICRGGHSNVKGGTRLVQNSHN